MSTTSYNMETDISKLEAPTFTTIDRGQPEPMLALDWDHPVNLVGKKVLNPMIHCCDKCLKPILIYGRMIPCKHVFCLACAKKEDRKCPRCGDKVTRVEQAGLGNIYLCTQGGSRYGNTGCRRTYLSSRDLQAHVHHRHIKPAKQEDKHAEKKEVSTNEAIRNAVNSLSKASLAAAVAAANSASAYSANSSSAAANYSTSTSASFPPPPVSTTSHHGGGSHISVINTRQSNLITVPLHSEGGQSAAVPPPAESGAGPSVQVAAPVYPPHAAAPSPYSPYSAYPSANTGGVVQPTPVTYAQQQPPAQNFSQPPPTYTGYPPGSYPATSPAPGQFSGPAPPPVTGQFATGPPPTAGSFVTPPGPYSANPPPAGQSYPPSQWSRPPPQAPHQAYYRR